MILFGMPGQAAVEQSTKIGASTKREHDYIAAIQKQPWWVEHVEILRQLVLAMVARAALPNWLAISPRRGRTAQRW